MFVFILTVSSCSDYYPLFKPGVDSLGSQMVHIEVKRTIVTQETATQEREEGSIEILVSQTLL